MQGPAQLSLRDVCCLAAGLSCVKTVSATEKYGNRTEEEIMEYEEIRELKQSEKSAVHLVREKGGERVFVRKILKGRHEVYGVLYDSPHPFAHVR